MGYFPEGVIVGFRNFAVTQIMRCGDEKNAPRRAFFLESPEMPRKLADTRAEKCPLVLIGGRVEGQACADM